MRWAKQGCALLVMAVVVDGAIASDYNRVDTFQPGKKYSCLPTADRKGWDCSEAGKAVIPANEPRADDTPPPAKTYAVTNPPPPSEPVAMRSEPARTDSVDAAPAAAVPNYLKAAPENSSAPAPPPPQAASSEPVPVATPAPPPPPVAPAPAEPTRVVAAPPPPAPVAPEPATTRTVEPVTAAPEPAAAAAQAPAPVSVAREPMPTPSASAVGENGNQALLSLPPSSYVIELAHGASRAELDAVRSGLQLPRGEMIELHLTREGADWWLLVWSSFDSVATARSARSELAATSSTAVGWPRPVAALQTEVRRASSN